MLQQSSIGVGNPAIRATRRGARPRIDFHRASAARSLARQRRLVSAVSLPPRCFAGVRDSSCGRSPAPLRARGEPHRRTSGPDRPPYRLPSEQARHRTTYFAAAWSRSLPANPRFPATPVSRPQRAHLRSRFDPLAGTVRRNSPTAACFRSVDLLPTIPGPATISFAEKITPPMMRASGSPRAADAGSINPSREPAYDRRPARCRPPRNAVLGKTDRRVVAQQRRQAGRDAEARWPSSC